MPLIDTYKELSKPNKFVKKSYRPWDDFELDIKKDPINSHDQIVKNCEPKEEPCEENTSVISKDDHISMPSINSEKLIEGGKSEIVKNVETIQTSNNKSDKDDLKPDIYPDCPFESVLFFLKGLGPVQKQLVFFVVNLCISKGQLSSGPINHEMLTDVCGSDINTIKNALHRLTNKGYLTREQGKKGRGGFCSFVIYDVLRSAVVHELQHKIDKKVVSKNFGGSIHDMDTQSTLNSDISYLPEEWGQVDITPLNHIKFSEHHVQQIYKKGKLTAEMMQTSINAFAFDMRENKKAEKLNSSPLNFFLGILCKGIPYTPPENYESPEEKAIRLYVKQERERVAARKKYEEEAIQLAFDEWEKGLSAEEIKEICPSDSLKGARLRTYFKEHVWEKIKKI